MSKSHLKSIIHKKFCTGTCFEFSSLDINCSFKTKVMKTIIAIIGSAMFFVSALSSCQSCTICEKGSEPDGRICKSDYNNDSQSRQAIKDKENGGFSCHN